MNNNEEKRFKEKYEELKKSQKKMSNLLDRIKELETDMYVKEYLNTKKELNELSKEEGYELPYITEEELLEKALKKSKIEESNNIYVCVGAYNGKYGLDKDNIKSKYRLKDAKVKFDDDNIDYKRYYNVELSKEDEDFEVNVPIQMCKEFEHNNIVLYPVSEDFAEQYYNYIKRVYLSTIVDQNQEVSLENILTKRKNNER